MIDIVEKAAENVGGVVALATRLNIKHQSFYSWKKVPAKPNEDTLTGDPRPTVSADRLAEARAEQRDRRARVRPTKEFRRGLRVHAPIGQVNLHPGDFQINLALSPAWRST